MSRLIFSLLIDFDSAGLLQFVAPLESDGRSRYVTPEGKPRAVDLRVGDWFRHPSGRYRVNGIRAYREARGDAESISEIAQTRSRSARLPSRATGGSCGRRASGFDRPCLQRTTTPEVRLSLPCPALYPEYV